MERDETDRLLRHAEHHYDTHNFNDLYELAVSVCLQAEPETVGAPNDSPDARLIRQLGVRGLGTALTMQRDGREFYFGITEDEKGLAYVTPTLFLRDAARTDLPTDPEVQDKIEAFGRQLLDEAYRSLGPDVDERIQQFKDATTDAEQLEVLSWLDKRIAAIKRRAGDDPAQHDELFYHPMRLSPKLMGQYPESKTVPTCLSVSVLAGSFFTQTGADTLHSGVMNTYAQKEAESFTEMCRRLADRDDLKLPDAVIQKLYSRADDLTLGSADQAFHAASLVRLASGAWYIFDPNYQSSGRLQKEGSDRISSVYEELQNFKTVAPGLEEIVSLTEDLTIVEFITQTAWRLRMQKTKKKELDSLLSPELLEGFQENIRAHVRDRIGTAKHPKPIIEQYYASHLLPHLDEEVRYYNWRNNIIFDEGFDHAWQSFFLYGEEAQDIIDRAAVDPAYRQRKLEDLRALPYLTLLLSAREIARVDHRQEGQEDSIHVDLEVGLPEYRIGMAVLSDFASYCGNDMSYAFWTAHWPSIIPLTEHTDQANGRPHNFALMLNNISWLKQTGLIYYKQNGIVLKSDTPTNE